MTINNIQVNGLDEGNAYYFLNPIFLEIKSDAKFVQKATLRFTNTSALNVEGNDLTTTDFRLQSNPEGIIYVDISEYIKSVAVYLNGYRAKVINNNLPYSLNNFNFTIEVITKEDEEPTVFNFTKQFVYGYNITSTTNNVVTSLNLPIIDPETQEETNVPLYIYPTGSGFSPSLNVAKSYSRLRYRIVGNQIESYLINEAQVSILNHIHVTGCNNVTFRFLNSSGGYSHIIFFTYTTSSSNNVNNDKIKINHYSQRRVSYLPNEVTSDKEYTAISEFDSRFRYIVDEFIRSQYVLVSFGLQEKFFPVDIQQNQMPSTSEDSFELAYKFKLTNSINI